MSAVTEAAPAHRSMSELAAQVAGILGASAEPDLVARLHERSEGNACFAEGLIAASAQADGPLRSSLRDVLNLRLEALREDEYVFYTARAYATAARAAAELAERARALGDDEGFEEAQRYGDEVLQRFRLLLASERWPGGPPPPESVAFEAQCVAELTRARGTPDPGAWAAVAERFQALGLPFELAYARWRHAEALVLGGDRAAAQDALREAAGLAREMHAALLAAEIDGLARRARIALDEKAPAEVGGDSDLDALG